MAAWEKLLEAAAKDALAQALPAWIESRPWSHGAAVGNVATMKAAPIPGVDHACILLVTDDRQLSFAIPLAVAASSDGAIGGVAIDALTLPEVGEALVALVRAGGEIAGDGFTLRFHAPRSARADRWCAKVVHMVEPGESPELEMVRFLNAAGYRYIAPLAGWAEVAPKDAAGATFAIIEGFVPRRGTALDHLREELNRWFDEILQMGDVDPPKLSANDILSRALFPLSDDVNVAVGDYIRTAALLGTRVGEMHKLLARTSVDAFAPEPLDGAARERIVNETQRGVGDSFAVLDVRAADVAPALQNAIATLVVKRPNIEKRVNNLLAAPEGAVRIRTHGDLRLDRVLYTTEDDFLVDGFEGDRTRPLAERKMKRSPLEDVATMLRSIHKSVTKILRERPTAQQKRLAGWAEVFHRAASASFLGGWLRSASESTVLPAAPAATRSLLDAFLIGQCARELEAETEEELAVGLDGLREVLDNERKPGQMRTSRSFSPFVQSLRAVKVEPPRLTPEDEQIKAFHDGSLTHAQRIFGTHLRSDGYTEVAVWAPNAIQVAVVGDFNDWSSEAGLLSKVGETGIHAGRIRSAKVGQRYMFRIPGIEDAPPHDKADPFAQASEEGRRHASIITRADYAWGDAKWMQGRRQKAKSNPPISILEVEVDAGYKDIALSLAARAKALGFTHVELLFPHTFFAPAPTFGTTEDLMFLVDTLHQDGIGVLFAWTPAEFASNHWGLAELDGMPLYESDDPARAIHPVSGMGLFDLGKPEAQSFLLSSALFWVEELHADGLRIDGLATAIYLDDRRAPGTWAPNPKGGRENLEGVAFVQKLTKALKSTHPDVLVIADDSVAAMPPGLGFDRRCDATYVDDLRFHLGLDARGRANHDLPSEPPKSLVVTAIDEVAAAKGLDANGRRIFLALSWALPGKKLVLSNDDGETEPTIAELNRLYQSMTALQGDDFTAITVTGDLLAFKRADAVIAANLGTESRSDHGLTGKWKVMLDTGGPTGGGGPGSAGGLPGEDRIVSAPELSLPARSVLFLVPA